MDNVEVVLLVEGGIVRVFLLHTIYDEYDDLLTFLTYTVLVDIYVSISAGIYVPKY